MVKKILNVIVIILFILWFYVIISDYKRVSVDIKPKYCIVNKVIDYDDGYVEECLGLGYKVYYYNRKTLKIKSEFGPLWIKIKENNHGL